MSPVNPSIIQFAIDNQLKFIGFHMGTNKEGKKEINEYEQKKLYGWKTKTQDDLITYYENNIDTYEWKTIFICPSFNHICIDTDNKETNDWVEEYLEEEGLTPAITSSFSCSVDKPYKKHYWFCVNGNDFLDRVKDGTEQFKNIDILYGDKSQVLERIGSHFTDPDVLSYNEFKKMHKIISSKFSKKTPITDNNNKKIDTIKKSNVDDDIIITILDNLNENRWNTYEDWIKIYMIFVNENLDLDLFNTYSKKSSKYNKEKNDKFLKSIRSINKGLTLASLFFMLKEDNIEVFKSLQPKRNDFIKLIYNQNHNDYSKIFYQLEPKKYVVSQVSGWYVYNKYNVLECCGDKYPPSLLNNISNVLQSYIEEQKQFVKLDDEKFTEKMKKIKSAYDSCGMGSYTEGIIKYLRTLYTIDNLDDMIDANQKLFSFEDTLFDISINKFRPIETCDFIKTTNKLYITKTETDKEQHTKVISLLKSIFEDDKIVEYWLSITGLSLFTTKFESFFILTGSGGNGKGLLSTIIEKALGNYYYQAPSSFLSTKFECDKPSPTLAKCLGVRYLSISEPESDINSPLKVDFIKSITGGDLITCRALHKNNITYRPQFTPFLQCNDMPTLNKMDGGINRRLKVINYPFKFVENPLKDTNERKINMNLKNDITPEFINEFLLILFEYAHKNIDMKIIVQPSAVINSSSEYLDNNNPVKEFINTYLELTSNQKDTLKCSTILDSFHRVYPTRKDIDIKKIKTLLEFNNIKVSKKLNSNVIIGYVLKTVLET